ncbi:MAG: YetF domain-containing protein [Arthrobacter oryzae]
MWFDSWPDILRTVVVGSAAYVTLVLILRVSGKRTLGQLNAFDLVVSVALGSTLATILLSKDVSWAEGATAFTLLAALQFGVATVSTKWPVSRKVITSQPAVLLWDGVFERDALRSNRLTEAEIRQAARESGYGDLSLLAAVVLETNGKLSVIPVQQIGDGSALRKD